MITVSEHSLEFANLNLQLNELGEVKTFLMLDFLQENEKFTTTF
jgi:hypothetical protein